MDGIASISGAPTCGGLIQPQVDFPGWRSNFFLSDRISPRSTWGFKHINPGPIPVGICWVVERSFAWISRYRRLNTIFDRTMEHLVAFIEIAFVSILSRRLKRLATDELSA